MAVSQIHDFKANFAHIQEQQDSFNRERHTLSNDRIKCCLDGKIAELDTLANKCRGLRGKLEGSLRHPETVAAAAVERSYQSLTDHIGTLDELIARINGYKEVLLTQIPKERKEALYTGAAAAAAAPTPTSFVPVHPLELPSSGGDGGAYGSVSPRGAHEDCNPFDAATIALMPVKTKPKLDQLPLECISVICDFLKMNTAAYSSGFGSLRATSKVLYKMVQIAIIQKTLRLGIPLGKAANTGEVEIVNAILAHGRFGEVNPYWIGDALYKASRNGHLEVVNAMIANSRFREISDEDLSQALIIANQHGHSTIANALITHARFSEISAFYFMSILQSVASTDQLTTLNAMMSHPKFKEISPVSLNYIFRRVIENNRTDMVNAIASNERFTEIPADELKETFIQASRLGNLPAVNWIMGHIKFKEISAGRLGDAVCAAAENNHLAILNTIIADERFKEIWLYDLGNALKNAAKAGHLAIVNAIVSTRRFWDFSSAMIEEALKEAADNREVVDAIKTHQLSAGGKALHALGLL